MHNLMGSMNSNLCFFLLLECVWYCGSCCGCGLKKVVLKKVLLVVVGLEKYMFG
jgi:hypothetical protein